MRKNTAGLVALIVLAIATLLMIFVVLPNVGNKATPSLAENPAPVPDSTAPGTPGAVSGSGDTTTANAKGDRPVATDPSVAAGQPNSPDQPGATSQTGGADQAAATPSATTPAAPATTPSAGAAPADTNMASAKPAPAGTGTAALDAPSFDVLRVEPDGSTVIAGRAEPNSKLEIVNGNDVVGTADVGGTGDFAAVFDKPLAPGDYQLTLRSTTPTGAVSASEEVATVSIPKVANGQLLAMVTKPGEASRVLTAPDAPATAGQIAAPITTPSSGARPATPAKGGNTAAVEAPVAAGSSVVATAQPGKPATAGPASPVAVTAVEIEGRKLFVAGVARPGSTVRIYADGQLVGEGKADAQGRFVVDGEVALSVGQHVIRVDMIGTDGKVQMRAAVPFERPEGDQISAIAQTPASGADPAFDGAIFDGSRMEAAKAFALLKGLFADGKLPGLDQLAAARSATEIALGSLAGVKPVAGMQQAVADRITATTKAAGEALGILKPLPRDAAAVGAALGRLETAMARVLETTPPAAAGNRPAIGSAQPAPLDQSAKSQAPASPSGSSTPGQASPGQASPDQASPGQPSPSSAPAVATALSPQGTAGEPETVQQAPLQQSKTSVIIRRGDTLWQISRRVYGAGVRYTTIYIANEDQILDPDRILPGQVFGVPDTALPDSESQEIHRRHMKHMP